MVGLGEDSIIDGDGEIDGVGGGHAGHHPGVGHGEHGAIATRGGGVVPPPRPGDHTPQSGPHSLACHLARLQGYRTTVEGFGQTASDNG